MASMTMVYRRVTGFKVPENRNEIERKMKTISAEVVEWQLQGNTENKFSCICRIADPRLLVAKFRGQSIEPVDSEPPARRSATRVLTLVVKQPTSTRSPLPDVMLELAVKKELMQHGFEATILSTSSRQNRRVVSPVVLVEVRSIQCAEQLLSLKKFDARRVMVGNVEAYIYVNAPDRRCRIFTEPQYLRAARELSWAPFSGSPSGGPDVA